AGGSPRKSPIPSRSLCPRTPASSQAKSSRSMAARGLDAGPSDFSMVNSGPRERRLAYLAWIAVCLIWGTTYLGIRIALETIPPFLMGAWRWIVAGLLILAILAVRRERLPPVRLWGSLAILGVLLISCGNGGVVWAERTVPSGLTADLVAMSPFWMVGIEALMPDGDRLTARRVFGLLIGFTGIIVLVWPEVRLGGARGFLA